MALMFLIYCLNDFTVLSTAAMKYLISVTVTVSERNASAWVLR